jgi:hypothetical protein
MASIEQKRKEIELMRVNVARQELELKIEEKQEEIKKLQDYVRIQLEAEEKIRLEIESMKK